MRRALTENKVLKKLDIPDFYHLRKEHLIPFASMMNRMDPEVVKKALDQIPNFTASALDIVNDYKDISFKILENNEETVQERVKICIRRMDALEEILNKGDLSFEQEKDILDEMNNVSCEMRLIDRENKVFHLKVIVEVGAILLGTIVVIAAALGGVANTDTSDHINNDDKDGDKDEYIL